ncbi:hypothetical protein OPV22_000740 [Ensete ventricosum]|uniref:Uncharacterized protein n=1 Tax=Ensete ventricosum TaxID=4639 RepID=A0AAV8QA81_ENSVE|nr:hypothetical protein OPV22_000740 [Ensete ventricosum]
MYGAGCSFIHLSGCVDVKVTSQLSPLYPYLTHIQWLKDSVGDVETIFHSLKNLNQQVACGYEDEKYKLANLQLLIECKPKWQSVFFRILDIHTAGVLTTLLRSSWSDIW